MQRGVSRSVRAIRRKEKNSGTWRDVRRERDESAHMEERRKGDKKRENMANADREEGKDGGEETPRMRGTIMADRATSSATDVVRKSQFVRTVSYVFALALARAKPHQRARSTPAARKKLLRSRRPRRHERPRNSLSSLFPLPQSDLSILSFIANIIDRDRKKTVELQKCDGTRMKRANASASERASEKRRGKSGASVSRRLARGSLARRE